MVDWHHGGGSKQWVTIEQNMQTCKVTSLPWVDPKVRLRESLPFLMARLLLTWEDCLRNLDIATRPGPMMPLFDNPEFEPGVGAPKFLIWNSSSSIKLRHTLVQGRLPTVGELIQGHSANDFHCKLEVMGLDGIKQPGDVILGAVLPVRVADVYQYPTFTARPPTTTCTFCKQVHQDILHNNHFLSTALKDQLGSCLTPPAPMGSSRSCFSANDFHCKLEVMGLDGIKQPGDVILGAVLPVQVADVYQYPTFIARPPTTTCTLLHFGYFQQLQALLFAVEQINRNRELLPNITLGVQWYDSCGVIPVNIAATLQVLTGQSEAIPNYRCMSSKPFTAFIGSASSTHSIAVANILGLYHYPQISHYATSSLLSDRIKFPSFFRTVPSDAFQSKGLAKLVLHFRWTWIGLLAVDNDYGQQGIQLFKQEVTKAGTCVAFTENILTNKQDRNAPHIVKVIKQSTARIIVVFSAGLDLLPILDEMVKQNITGKTFVASEGWSTTTLQYMGAFSNLLFGTVGLAFYSGLIPGFQEYLNKIHPNMTLGGNLVKSFWEETFNCKFPNSNNVKSQENFCTGEESLDNIKNSYNDVTNLRVAYNIYTAVNVVAKALQDLQNCNKAKKGLLSDGSCADIYAFSSWQLLNHMKKVRVTLSSGRELFFNENGDPPAVYDIVNWQATPEGSMRQVKIGSYDTTAPPGQVFTVNSSLLLWATESQKVPVSICSESCLPGFRKATRSGQPACCFQCVPCPQGEVSNETDSLDCFKCPWNEWPNLERSQCLQKHVEFLSFEDALGSTLAASAVFSSMTPHLILRLFIFHKSTPIVKASNFYLSCLLLMSLSLCFLCALAFIGYPYPEKCLLRQAAFGLAFTLCISCILAKTIMVVFAFMATKPGSNLKRWTSPRVSYLIIMLSFLLQLVLCVTWLSLASPFPHMNTQSQPMVIIVECNEGSPIAFWTMLGYLFLLATISFIAAFLARRLPDSYNEAQLITFSMLAFLSVWISFIPASFSAQGKYVVAMEIFAILASSWALVICMFLPKCFIILFRPNINTKEYLIRKDRRR
ncbi:vomeronasal type-2 receptor 1-like [Gastrophryne carolinensis]